VRILDKKVKMLQNRLIELVKVQWTYYGLEYATWEHEDSMRVEYPQVFLNKFWNFDSYFVYSPRTVQK
jgi:hypothetical protein